MADVIDFPRPKSAETRQEDSLTVLHWAHVRINHVLESRLTELIDAEEALNLIMTILEEPEVRIAVGLVATETSPIA